MLQKFCSLKILKNIYPLRKSDCFSSEKFKSFLIKYAYSKNIKMESVPENKKESKELPVGTVEEFAKMDIRIGEITECWKVKI